MLDAFDKIFLCCTLSPRGKCKCIFCAQSRNRFFCNFASGKLYSTTTRKICFLSDIILWSNLAPAFSASLRFTAARPCKKFATKVNGAKTLRNIGWGILLLVILAFGFLDKVHLMTRSATWIQLWGWFGWELAARSKIRKITSHEFSASPFSCSC